MLELEQETTEIQHIQRIFDGKTAHHYLNKYIDPPEIEKDIIFFLWEAMRTASVSAVEKREQILAALFIHAAFETHEKVETGRHVKHGIKHRQLAVLAGDFFSSLYYSMLVDNGHVKILPIFSDSIQKINEQKMSLHFCEYKEEEELLESLRSAEGSLVANIAAYYGKEGLGTLAKTYFLLKKMYREREREQDKHLSSFAEGIYSFVEGRRADIVSEWPPPQTKSFLDEQIRSQQAELSRQLKTSVCHKNTPLFRRLKAILS
ncbi:heptaprenyl diphosphate synthase component 1 [Bacillus piscicola]|uniref:heptaprenyl diphosphate synthase component 1 n=1 Tax=Bacillus piscicola TaxID=1632684 RepID=UPI001F08D762|nr:heptaprenyl diphosphate synthase component 1 [Bacillus piscicola]